MSREIKFRAWDGERIRHEFMVARPRMSDCLSVMASEKFAQSVYHLKEWKLMQYTGLRDKNGIEIYEGDIIRYGASKETGIVADVYIPDKVVEWHEKIAGFGLDKESIEDMYEVVDNIYENPELIKHEQ